NIVLGRMSTERPLGGALRIHADLARNAVGALAARLRLDRTRLAEGIIDIAVARMTASIREISIQQGHDPRDFTLIAFGGAGPMHAIPVAEELGIPRVLVPRHPGNFSALGLLVSDVKHDDVRTRIGRLHERVPALEAAFAEMSAAAARRLDADGFDERDRLPGLARVDGPAIVEEFGATTVVFPAWRARLAGAGHLVLERGA